MSLGNMVGDADVTQGGAPGGAPLVGVVPAAGHARRLQPLPCSKEVYPIGGRPVMDYLVERMRYAGCREVRVVTRPDKVDVIDHAQKQGASLVIARPSSVAASFLVGLRDVPRDAIVLFGFPDTIWEPEDGFSRLIEALDVGVDVVLGLFEAAEPERSDLVTVDGSGYVTSVDVKPAVPRSRLLWGCGVARAYALHGLEGAREPGEYFDALCQSTRIRAVRLPGPFTDIGTRAALARAQLP